MYKSLLDFFRLASAALAFLICTNVSAGPMLITIDTSAFAGTSATLAFDFIGDQNNVAELSGLKPAPVDGTQVSVGDVSGNLASKVILNTENNFFNEFLVDIIFSNSISFQIYLSENGPSGIAAPDAFSFFILDPGSGLPLFPTNDPSGADSLFRIDVDGSSTGFANIFGADGVSISIEPLSQELPEPSTALLFMPLLLILMFQCSKRASVLWKMCLCFFLVLATPARAQEDLGSQIKITKSGAVLNRAAGTYDYIVSVTNISSNQIIAPLTLAINNVAGPEVSVYNASSLDENAIAQVTAALEWGVLKPGATVKIPVRFVNPRAVSISFSVSATGLVLSAQDSVNLKVRTFTSSETDRGPAGSPAGSGIILLIDGIPMAVTDSAGEASLNVAAGAESIDARRAPTTVGTAQLELMPGKNNTIDIAVHDDGQVYANGTPRIDEVRQLLLTRDFTSFTGRITGSSGATIKLSRLAAVDRYDFAGKSLGSLTSSFVLNADGSFRPADLPALRNLLRTQQGRITLTVMGVDSANNVYVGDVSFYLSSNAVAGRLAAPVSSPGMALGGIRVVGRMLNTDIVVSTVTDADGKFKFPDLSNGNLSIAVEHLYKDRYYYGAGIFTLTGPADLEVPLVTAAETSSVNALSTLAASSSKSMPLNKDGTDARRPEDMGNTTPVLLPQLGDAKSKMFSAAAAASSASVSVVAGAAGLPIEDTAKLMVPKGSSKVKLSYVVGTAEYPYYVTAQSVYNDVWKLRLFGGAQGAQLFDITRQINSQLTQSPVWMSNGTTGIIEQTFDVQEMAKNSDIELALVASAMNVGDSALPTNVNATITVSSGLAINVITPTSDPWTALNDKTYYSVPLSGAFNKFHRKVTLQITKPTGATITNLKVDMLAAGGEAKVLDTKPSADVVILSPTKLRSVVTFKLESSTVNSVPAPDDMHQYRFTLTATDENGNELTAEKTSSAKHPLWRMPSGFVRYGPKNPAAPRDVGGDDWVSRPTYLWMDQNRLELRPIGDISGEHGKDIGHQGHAEGNDIDMYHFYTFPGVDEATGIANYEMLVKRIKELPKQNSALPQEKAIGTAAAQQISAWIGATRTGIDNLSVDPRVEQIGYIDAGPAAVSGISGEAWGATLIKTGKIVVSGKEYKLADTTWNNGKYHPWPLHHHHVHISLSSE